ncbi:stage III sporulation protein AA|uniref:Stage III sporulation protein AA n=1 Tax=Dendrosporobacter quercicolus TaxID=146817 RepID=A0A1G9KWN6_9FIRM|nr:stage III sporulation protein AA [Dendrosporobacter quercicolus]NSL46518.1 stage III sporulation protein AA [Dendrosporobacter quercicolus DSM 1736]SDL53954.1 stage III sporulation protein AA [Dendrosporobacter quercicolus]
MNQVSYALEHHIYPVLAPALKGILRALPAAQKNELTEIRLRVGQPLLLITGVTDLMVGLNGQSVVEAAQAYVCSREDVSRTLQAISRNSLYAFEQELKQGYITISGGHRVGLAGQAIVEGGELKALKNISFLNIRIAREVTGCADRLIPYLIGPDRQVLSTLIIAPPRCGKTTLLRDIVRQLSSGDKRGGFPGMQVGVVDERSEIAACRDGIPTVQLGPRVDVLDCCPKAGGILMLIRSMSPQVVVTDELGRNEDVTAVREALNAGIRVIASIHGHDAGEVLHRPYICELIEHRYFDRYVVLSNQPGVGTITEIIAVKQNEILYSLNKGVKICG